MGPGALPSDAFMLGIDVQKQRDRMDEAIGVLVPLMRGETVTHKSDWFELCDARLQLAPYTRPHVEMCVASQISPAGARAAGKHGLGLLSLGATSTGGFNMLAANWQIAQDKAREYGHAMQREAWRLVGPMHVAETRRRPARTCASASRTGSSTSRKSRRCRSHRPARSTTRSTRWSLRGWR
jgi:limonene 1,2-monooxygenase